LVLTVVMLLWIGPAPVARGDASPEAGGADSGGSWEFVIAPYIWLPAMSGEATVKGQTARVDTSISDIFTSSDFAFALQAEFEAWYERRWGILFNGQWGVLKQNDNVIGPPIAPQTFDLKMNNGLFEFAGLYSFGERPFGPEPGSATWTVETLVGVRVTVLKVELDFDSGAEPDQGKTWADPILGARGIVRFGNDNRWSATLRGDFGGFGAGSDITWNLAGMFGYDFHIGSLSSRVFLGARALYQDFEDGSGSQKFAWDVTQFGPLLGLALRF
jgi:hypothetical protein